MNDSIRTERNNDTSGTCVSTVKKHLYDMVADSIDTQSEEGKGGSQALELLLFPHISIPCKIKRKMKCCMS